jgi:hypothetical protein
VFTEEEVSTYSDEELDKFFAACDDVVLRLEQNCGRYSRR